MNLLRRGDKLSIAGDSITEQCRYSRIIESYLLACMPQLEVELRQSGWGGETTGAFLERLDEDILAYRPTLVISAYGMNDFAYDKFSEATAQDYLRHTQTLIRRIKTFGARHLLASPGCISLPPNWCELPNQSMESLNASLARIRDLGREAAQSEALPFCDVFEPMLSAQKKARELHGPGFHIAGDDGVHPDWAGHLVMAAAELEALGMDGDLGSFELNAESGLVQVNGFGHQLIESGPMRLRVRSLRYPYCVPEGDLSKNSNIAAGVALIPFYEKLNRLNFRLLGAKTGRYQLRWGSETKLFEGIELERGINLAECFAVKNPFSAAFEILDEAVGRKQAFESYQLHQVFHGPSDDRERLRKDSELTRYGLLKEAREALRPIEHEIQIQMLP